MDLKLNDAVQWKDHPFGIRGTVLKTRGDRALIAFADGTERWCVMGDVEPAKVWTTEEVVAALSPPGWYRSRCGAEDGEQWKETGSRNHLHHGPMVVVPVSLCEAADEWMNQVHGKAGPVGEYKRNLTVCGYLVCGCWPCSLRDSPYGRVAVLHFDHAQPAAV